MLLRVAQTCRSSHIQMYFEIIESKFSFIQVAEISATDKCHESFARRYRLYNLNLFLGRNGNRSIWEIASVRLTSVLFCELHLTFQNNRDFHFIFRYVHW